MIYLLPVKETYQGLYGSWIEKNGAIQTADLIEIDHLGKITARHIDKDVDATMVGSIIKEKNETRVRLEKMFGPTGQLEGFPPQTGSFEFKTLGYNQYQIKVGLGKPHTVSRIRQKDWDQLVQDASLHRTYSQTLQIAKAQALALRIFVEHDRYPSQAEYDKFATEQSLSGQSQLNRLVYNSALAGHSLESDTIQSQPLFWVRDQETGQGNGRYYVSCSLILVHP